MRLEEWASAADLRVCDGCARCATRCIDNIEITYPEFTRLMDHLAQCSPHEIEAVLGEDKRLPLWEDVYADLCPFLDMSSRRCFIYSARPLICRLFGVAPWLPCPEDAGPPPLETAVAILQEYALLERHTLRQWLCRTGGSLPGLLGE